MRKVHAIQTLQKLLLGMLLIVAAILGLRIFSVELRIMESVFGGRSIDLILQLIATGIGVYLAQYLANKRAEKDEQVREKKVFKRAIPYLFGEIMNNFHILQGIVASIKETPPPDSYDAARFINNSAFQQFEDRQYTAFVSSGAYLGLTDDAAINAIQQIYSKISEIKLKWSMGMNIGKPENDLHKKLMDSVFSHIIQFTIDGHNFLLANIPIILKYMKKRGMTYKIIVSGKTEVDLMDEKNFYQFFYHDLSE